MTCMEHEMASSVESRMYARIMPTTRLKNAVGDLAKARVALQHLRSYDGVNLSDEQVVVAADAVSEGATGAIAKLSELKKRVNDFLRKV